MATRKILILNSGSSSLKYNLFNNDENFSQITKGNINIIKNGSSTEESPKNHAEAIEQVEKQLVEKYGCKPEDLLFIAHRVVHGGQEFTEHAASEVDPTVMKKIEDLSQLAPLHNPVNLLGIKECAKIFQGVPQFAVFDTSFHSTLPPKAYMYALPSVVSSKVRKYGFHGTSHKYVGRKAAELLGKTVEQTKVITLHLGNGASACAINNDKSIDTSMGMTPLEGLVMGTRCGDIDPAAVFHLITKQNKQIDWKSDHEAFLHIEDMLNKEAGLKGICGSSDMRDIQDKMASGDESAKLAFDVFTYRIKRYIGSYFVALEGCDAIVFTAGIGENSALVRSSVCQGLSCIGVELDEEANKQIGGKGKRENADVSKPESKVKVLVIFTDEEREIASLALQEYILNRQK